MNDVTTTPKPKKSVALSGVIAGNTALCTVGRTGNDLHYRGYDILDVAETCEFEEIAHLLVHARLPAPAELRAYKTKLRALRGIPAGLRTVLEHIPAAAHPMDVMRTAVSMLGCELPEKDDHSIAGARDIADRLMASLGSILLYWWHFSHNGRRIEVETDDDSIAAHFLHLLHGRAPSTLHERAMHTSLVLYAEHEFNASTFAARVVAGTGSDMYSAITGGIGALRGPKHGGANEAALDIQLRYATPDEAEADIRARVANKGGGDRLRPPRLYRQRPAQRGDQIGGQAPQRQCWGHRPVQRGGAAGNGDVGAEKDVPEPRLVQRRLLPNDGRADGDVHATFRHFAHQRLGRARHRTAPGRQDHPPDGELHRAGRPEIRAAGGSPRMTYLVGVDLPVQPAGDRFRALLAQPGIVRLPGAHNGLASLQARAQNFPGVYLSGAAMSASMGLPDLGVITIEDVCFFVRQVARASGLPVLVDGDTGYGEALNVMHMVRSFEDAGAAAVHLEDQLLPKKCGHLNDKRLATPADMAAKIAAAVRARRHLFVMARTDAAASEGMEGAVARAKLYVQAGATRSFRRPCTPRRCSANSRNGCPACRCSPT